jgi:cytoskeletal protein RodZ
MNDEYLWDKSGEPDPEIQQLEQILGTLRYQPKPLVLPDDVRPLQRNHRLPLIAIAASLLVALLAAGLWLIVTKKQEQPLNAKTNVPAAPSPLPEQASSPVKNAVKDNVSLKAEQPESNKVNKSVRRPSRMATPSPTTAEREQAIQVKQQLMVALRVASEKLSLAQRKTHGPSPNQIRNQHKVG